MRSIRFGFVIVFFTAGCATTLEDAEQPEAPVAARCDIANTTRLCQSLIVGADVSSRPRV